VAILILVLLVVLIVATIVIVRRRRRVRLRHNAPLPPLIFEVHDAVTPVDLRPASIRLAELTPPGVRAAGSARGGRPPSIFHTPTSFSPVSTAVFTDATVRMPRFEEAAQGFLPGRLEIQQGPNRGESIRFRRTNGDDADITLGRGEGPPESHIQVNAETVSRLHARLRFDHGRWKISNLSRTNPLLVNGEPLTAGAMALWLSEGDTIEMGEMTFRFHSS
jgi:hypothetical protein